MIDKNLNLNWQEAWATKRVLISFACVYLVFPFYLLPLILPEGRPLDLFLYYTPKEAMQIIASYTELDRQTYIIGSATIDVIYSIFYSIFLSLLLTFPLVRLYKLTSRIHLIRLLPFFLLAIDFSENVCIIVMLVNHPEMIFPAAFMAGLLTLTKWLIVIVIASAIVFFYWQYHRSSRRAV